MTTKKNRFTCLHPDCDKPATRVLTYWVDPPDVAFKDLKQDVFCDEHAEAEMLDLQKPGLFTHTGWDGTKMDCTINKLTNSPLEDDCRHELTKTTVEDL